MLRRFGEIPVASLYPILPSNDKRFLSPRGDKLQLFWPLKCTTLAPGFRPLAGISCNSIWEVDLMGVRQRFRPLAGISCNLPKALPPARSTCFRPLAGISCNKQNRFSTHLSRWFPSPRGDKLQLEVKETVRWGDLKFPSPRGDKLKHIKPVTKVIPNKVSVPSRG